MTAMLHRGRKSAAELSVVPLIPGAQRRPEPPKEFTAAEAEVWRLTVGAMRPDWFGPETRPLLRGYCTQVWICQLLQERLRGLSVDDKNFARLTNLYVSATKTMLTLATKLRLTPQSRRRSGADYRDPFHGRPRPWE
jgi:phage terminase small subunit